jgi:hypothetical protein
MIMGKIFTKKWFEATFIRMIRTGAEAALGVIGSSFVLSEIDWRLTISASVVAMIVSGLMALKGLPEV